MLLESGRKEKIERNREVWVDNEGAENEDTEGDPARNKIQKYLIIVGDIYTPDDIGSALSFALRLRKRNRGTNHTQIPKKDAISMNPGAVDPLPR